MAAGVLFVILAAVFWGFIGIFSTLAFRQGVSPMEVAFWRAVLAWFFFAGHAVFKRQTRIDAKDIPLLGLFGVFGVGLFYIAYQYAVKTAGAATASVLLYTAPAWVVLCSLFIYKEPATIVKISAVVCVIAGVCLISGSGGARSAETSMSAAAVGAGLCSGLCYSLYYTMGKYFSRKYSSATLFLYVLPVGALVIFPLTGFAPKTGPAWSALLMVAFVSTFLANYCYLQGVARLEAGKAAITATLEPVVAAMAAYLFFGEYFTVSGYLGAGLIILAVAVTVLTDSKG